MFNHGNELYVPMCLYGCLIVLEIRWCLGDLVQSMRLQLLFTLKLILTSSFPLGQHRDSLVTLQGLWLNEIKSLHVIHFLPTGTWDESTGNIYFIAGITSWLF